jgi:IclR family KDG regulon transcriptional repressor
MPIYSYTGQVVAAISAAGPTERMNKNQETIIRNLKENCTNISKRLGFVPTMRKSL